MSREGKKGSVNVNAGNYGSPSWTRIPKVADLKLPAEWDTIDMMDRDADVKTYLLSQLDLTIEFDLNYDPDNVVHQQMRVDCLAGTAKEYACLNGPAATSGSIGFRGEFLIKGFSVDMNLTEKQKVPIKLLPYAGYTHAPESYTI